MRVFVTGATGVIGRRVVPLLVSKRHAVTAVGRSAEKRAALERAGATPVELDLFAPDAVRVAVAGHDAILNLATHIPPSTGRMLMPGGWRENDRVRRVASSNLADAAIAGGVGRLVQESFAPMYVDGGDAWLDESWPVNPARYNRSALDAERAAARVTAHGGAGVVLRFAAFYGPDAFHVADMIRLVRKGWSPLVGRPEGFISSVSHDDAATAAAAALDLPAGIYNVVEDEPVRRRIYVDALAEVLDVPPPRFFPPWTARLVGSLGELLARSLRISNRKIREASGWRPQYPSVPDAWRAVVAALRG